MAIKCAKCGEELLGAVNRCWRCGQKFADPLITSLPPQRGALVPEVVTAELATAPAEAALAADVVAATVADADATAIEPTTANSESQAAAPAAAVMRRGSPFLPGVELTRIDIQPPPSATSSLSDDEQRVRDRLRRVSGPPNHAATGGAIAAIVCGFFAVAVSFFFWSGALVALMALCFGVWGLRSPKRNWALVGMLIASLAVAMGTYRGAVDFYIYRNQVSPWGSIEEENGGIVP